MEFGGFGSNDISVLQRTMDMLEHEKSNQHSTTDGFDSLRPMNIAEGDSLAKPRKLRNYQSKEYQTHSGKF
jgi:hypothetical protein